MSTSQETFQIPIEAAEAYEAKFVPSIFAEWAPQTLDAGDVGPGDRLLDVGCGTGIVARTTLDRVGPAGAVTGLDLNPAMLTVAERIEPSIEWHQADAAAMPFDDGAFDVAVSQMAFMFLPDPAAVFAEMARVVGPGGRVAVLVPASLDAQPAYRPFVEIACRHAGDEARSLLETYWQCGDLDRLSTDAESAGLAVTGRRTRTGTARFESAEDFVVTEVEGSPLAERIDGPTYDAIKAEVAESLARYTTDRGTFEVPLVCRVVSAQVSEG